MRNIEGACHCGNIRFELLWPLADAAIPVRACSCSFCVKHRGTYTSHPEARLIGRIADASLVNKYCFGTETAEFYICVRCGAVPFATSTIDGLEYAVVNVNTFDDVETLKLTTAVADFDGETTSSRLDRRKRTWIPHVRFTSSP